MSFSEKLKCRKVSSVMRYFTPNKNRKHVVYTDYLFVLIIHFEKKSDLTIGNSFTRKLAALDVISIANRNRSIIESSCEHADKTLAKCSGGCSPVNWSSQTRRNLRIEYLNLNFVTTPKLTPVHSFYAKKVFISCI